MATNLPPEKIVKSISRWMATEVLSGKEFVPMAQVKQWQEFMVAAAEKLQEHNCENCRIDVIGFDRIDAVTAELLRAELIKLLNIGHKVSIEYCPNDVAAILTSILEVQIAGINALSSGVARSNKPQKVN